MDFNSFNLGPSSTPFVCNSDALSQVPAWFVHKLHKLVESEMFILFLNTEMFFVVV